MTWLRSLREVLHGIRWHPQSSHISTITAIRAGGRQCTPDRICMTLTLDGTEHQGDTPTDATKKYEERAVPQRQLRFQRLVRREQARSALTLHIKSTDHLADTPKNATYCSTVEVGMEDPRGIHPKTVPTARTPPEQRTPSTNGMDSYS